MEGLVLLESIMWGSLVKLGFDGYRLRKLDGIDCGENRVARLMRENELAARRKQSFRPRTTVPGNGAAANLIKDLEPSGVDQVWVSDITYVATVEGWLYLAVILDLFSRKVVGWKLL